MAYFPLKGWQQEWTKKAVDELFKDMRALEKEQVNKGAKKAAAKGKGSCYGTLMQMDLQKDMFLVGDIFMRKFYSVFDRDHDRVGLAEAVHWNRWKRV